MSLAPIYGREGTTVAWLLGDTVRDRDGRSVALIRDGAVYSYDLRYLGRFDQGWFRDPGGNAVAFTGWAQGGPWRPLPQPPPLPPVPHIAPLPPFTPFPPFPPFAAFAWSERNWDSFLSGVGDGA